MHLQENTLFDLDLEVARKFKVATFNMHLQENTLFDLVLGVNVTGNVAQYPLHNVTYAPAKFEVATPNGLGDAFTRNVMGGHTDDGPTLV